MYFKALIVPGIGVDCLRRTPSISQKIAGKPLFSKLFIGKLIGYFNLILNYKLINLISLIIIIHPNLIKF